MEDQKRTKSTQFMGANLTPESIRDMARTLFPTGPASGPDAITGGNKAEAPFSSEAKAVFECALRESRRLGMSYSAFGLEFFFFSPMLPLYYDLSIYI